MKIDFDQSLKNLDGSNAKFTGDETLTLGKVCSVVLNMQAEQGDDVKEVAGNGLLAVQLYGGGKIDLTPEQVTSIRGKLSKAWQPVIVGQAYGMLDPSKK